MTRILFTIPNFITAGSGREMLNIVERLDRRRYEPTVCVLRKGGALEAEIEALGIPLIEAPFVVPVSPKATLAMRVWGAARRFRPYGFLLWHSFAWSSDYTEPLIARAAGARWIYTKKNMNWNDRAWRLRTMLAARVIARNQTMTQSFLGQRSRNRKTRLVHGGVDVQRFQAPAVVPAADIAPTVERSPVTVVCVAQLVRVKGQDGLLQAAAPMDGVNLVFAGAPADREFAAELERQVDALGIRSRVQFLGPVADVPTLLQRADIFVLPTSKSAGHEEGCPVALLEAMAASRACVATDVAGSRDLIEDGKHGLLVEPDNPFALRRALETLFKDAGLRQRLGAAARQRIEREFTLERESAAMQAVYEELLA